MGGWLIGALKVEVVTRDDEGKGMVRVRVMARW